ncbi:MAG: MarR family winged helix-turn-helix transcriptional regulator [Weeksellaceae bacterium]
MLKSALKKLIGLDQSDLTSYGIGLLHTKVYRILKERTEEFLKEHGLSSIEWAMLGLLYENKEGLRSSEIAELLGVEPPFVTELTNKLKKQAYIESRTSKEDKRARNITLSAKGRTLVPQVEKNIRNKVRYLVDGASIMQIQSYYHVLKTIVKNSSDQ